MDISTLHPHNSSNLREESLKKSYKCQFFVFYSIPVPQKFCFLFAFTLLWAAKEAVTLPQGENANASLSFKSIAVQKSAALHAKHFDPLKSPYCGTQKHDAVKRRCNRLPLECCLASYCSSHITLRSFCVPLWMSHSIPQMIAEIIFKSIVNHCCRYPILFFCNIVFIMIVYQYCIITFCFIFGNH